MKMGKIMKKRNFPLFDFLSLAVGELLVSLLVVAGYLIAALISESVEFTYRVITGALLGSLVTLANYLFMILSINKQVNRFIELRGNAAMDEESAKKFASENSASIQAAISLSFIIRTVTMLITLAVAFLLDCFAPVATVIPLLAFRPIITVTELLRARWAGKKDAPITAEFTDITDAATDTTADEKESDE